MHQAIGGNVDKKSYLRECRWTNHFCNQILILHRYNLIYSAEMIKPVLSEELCLESS